MSRIANKLSNYKGKGKKKTEAYDVSKNKNQNFFAYVVMIDLAS